MNSNTKGNIALGQAIAYFTQNEYTLSIPLNDCQWYDLIIEKNGIFQTVQVKYTSQKANENYICPLTTVNPKSGVILYSLVDKPLDLLYIYCSNNNMYLIPVKDIPNKTQITLYENHKSLQANLSTFDTSIYLINKKETDNKEYQNISAAPLKSLPIRNVLQYDLNGNFIKKYENCSDAARQINVAEKSGATHIAEVCRGKRKTAYGFQWKYDE